MPLDTVLGSAKIHPDKEEWEERMEKRREGDPKKFLWPPLSMSYSLLYLQEVGQVHRTQSAHEIFGKLI